MLMDPSACSLMLWLMNTAWALWREHLFYLLSGKGSVLLDCTLRHLCTANVRWDWPALSEELCYAFLLLRNVAFLKQLHHSCSFLCSFSASFGLVVFYVMPFEVQIKCGCNLKGLIIENMIFLLFWAGNVYNANAYNIVWPDRGQSRQILRCALKPWRYHFNIIDALIRFNSVKIWNYFLIIKKQSIVICNFFSVSYIFVLQTVCFYLTAKICD